MRRASRPHTTAPMALPTKWKYAWMGPHMILGRSEGNTYRLRHRSGRTLTANSNRLTQFRPWSQDVESTDRPAAADPDYKTYDDKADIEIGSLVAFALYEGGAPFGVAKVLSINEEGVLHFQYLSNLDEDPRQPLSMMWINRRGAVAEDKAGWIYDADYQALSTKDKGRYEPCTESRLPLGIDITGEGVIIHGFKLDPRGKMSKKLLTAISKDEHVVWTFGGRP